MDLVSAYIEQLKATDFEKVPLDQLAREIVHLGLVEDGLRLKLRRLLVPDRLEARRSAPNGNAE